MTKIKSTLFIIVSYIFHFVMNYCYLKTIFYPKLFDFVRFKGFLSITLYDQK